LYFTTASPVTGPFAGHTPSPTRARFPSRSSTLALLFVLAAVAVPLQAATVAAPRLPEAADAPKSDRGGAPTKASKATRRGKAAAAKVTVTAATASDKPATQVPVPAAGGERWDIVIADRTLNAAMARWAAAAGWQLLWELPVDYAVQAHTTVPGKFEDAVTLVVNSMEGAEIPMKAVFYSGNKVLRIMAKGAQ